MLNRRFVSTVAAGLAIAATAAVFAGCGSSNGGSSSPDATVKAVATTTQVADFVREVGGDEVDVVQILQPNTDPHDYEPRPSDVQAFADADLVFRSGEHLDEWTDQLVDDSGSNAQVIDLSDAIPVELHGGEHSHDDDHAEGEDHAEDEPAEGTEHDGEETHSEGDDHAEDGDEVDPHWWHDPSNVVAAIGEIETALAAADPDGKSNFKSDAAAYTKQVKATDKAIAKCFRSIPDDQRKMVTDHDAFSYLADHYDIDVVGTVIPALTTQAEPSAGDLAELERTIKEENVKAVFPESSVSKKLADAVAADTGATTDYELYGDTLGPEDSDGATYIGMMKSNANSLMLGFTAGERGCDFN